MTSRNHITLVAVALVVFILNACTVMQSKLVDQPELSESAPEMDMQVFELPGGLQQISFGTFKTHPFLKAKPDTFSFVMANEISKIEVKTTCTIDYYDVNDWIYVDGGFKTLQKGKGHSYLIEYQIGDQLGKMDFAPVLGSELRFNETVISFERKVAADTSQYAKFDGFVFSSKDQVVGAMEINSLKLWISRTALDDEGQMLLASLMTAIALQPDPENKYRSKWGRSLSRISERKSQKDLEKEVETGGLSRRERRDAKKAEKEEAKAAKKAAKMAKRNSDS